MAIFWFTGQPHAGKTTLAKHLHNFLLENSIRNTFLVDGDDLRKINSNKDYSEQGRRNNVSQAIAIAKYLDSLNYDVIVALVSPYKDMRDELKADSNVVEIYVHTTEIRGREHFHVENYEPPTEKFISIDTTNIDEISSMDELFNNIQNFVKMKKETKQVGAVEAIQKFIAEGREVIIKKENDTSLVRIRQNSMDINGSEKWRVIINGNEFRTNEVIINCPTRTMTEIVKEVGVKNHIGCDAKEIVFKYNIATIN